MRTRKSKENMPNYREQCQYCCDDVSGYCEYCDRPFGSDDTVCRCCGAPIKRISKIFEQDCDAVEKHHDRSAIIWILAMLCPSLVPILMIAREHLGAKH